MNFGSPVRDWVGFLVLPALLTQGCDHTRIQAAVEGRDQTDLSEASSNPSPAPSPGPSRMPRPLPTLAPSPVPTSVPSPALVGADHWVEVGGLNRGIIPALAYEPVTRTLCAGTISRGVFYSRDGGENWHPSSTQPVSPHVPSLVAHSSGQVYAANPEANGKGMGQGVFISSDGCRNWAPVNQGLADLKVSILLESADGSLLAGTATAGVVRRVPGADQWSATSLNAGSVTELVRGLSGVLYAAGPAGIFVSVDHGSSWTALAGFPVSAPNIQGLYVDSRGALFVGLAPRPRAPGLYVSRDGGTTWSDAGVNSMGVAVITEHLGLLYLATHRNQSASQIQVSSDRGATFSPLLSLPVMQGARSLLSLGGSLYIGANGVFRTDDSGETAVALNQGLTAAPNVMDLEVSPGGELHVGTDVGPARYRDGNWDYLVDGLSWLWTPSIGWASDRTWVLGNLFGYYFSEGEGRWLKSANLSANFLIRDFELNAAGDLLAATGFAGRVWRSSDQGESFEQMPGLQTAMIFEVKKAPDGRLYLASESLDIFESKDDGETWQSIQKMSAEPHSFGFTSKGELLIGTEGGGVFKRDPSGSILPSNSGIPRYTNVYDFETDGAGRIFAGTARGVYVSLDEGETWKSFGAGFPDRYMILGVSLAFLPNGRLCAGLGEEQAGVYCTTAPPFAPAGAQ